ncbi:hypothetical protein C4B68_35795 [Streptomyces dengpaensis]|uniref:Uncharacterized protein n=2 Tax=Streptomyces TaxID=1883 RepID=A0ABN5IAR6_9ACTN|nr:hypothetical protein C4B68_35795 [Streptomyces dengpaensis]PIB06719.1 hypothetical protein B1C81_23625 [Streptomyces sp. HG99]
MLRELTTDREDPGTPSRFIKASPLARHARLGNADDRREIDTNLNMWVGGVPYAWGWSRTVPITSCGS